MRLAVRRFIRQETWHDRHALLGLALAVAYLTAWAVLQFAPVAP